MNIRLMTGTVAVLLLSTLCQTATPAQTKPESGNSKKASTTLPDQTSNTEASISFRYIPKGSLFPNDPPKLLIRTLAYRLSLQTRGVLISKLRINIFLEAKLGADDFEKSAEGKFIVKKAPEFFFVHLMNCSDPNLTFDTKSDRLFWFDRDNSRWVLGTLDPVAISNYNIRSSSPAPLETIVDMLARKDEVTELLTTMEFSKHLPKLIESKQVTGHLGEFQFEVNQSFKAAIKAFSDSIRPLE